MSRPVPVGIIQQYDAFWNAKNQDALLYMGYDTADVKVSAQAKGLFKPWMDTSLHWGFAAAVNLAYKTGDSTYVSDILELHVERLSLTRYAGAGFPTFTANLGAGSLAAMLTGYAHLYQDTVWFELDEPWPYERILALNDFHPYADTVMAAMKMTAERLGGLAVLSVNDLGGLADVLSSLRRCDGILYDLHDCPDDVAKALGHILKFWLRAHKETQAILEPVNGGLYTHWMQLLAPHPYYPHQCDACALIGPQHFRELILPSLAAEMAHFPATVYHLDGSHCIVHLDALCESPTLKAIQWVPEPGVTYHDEQYHPLYARILELGRKIVFTGWRGDADDMRRFFKRFPREAFFISTGVKDAAEAAEYLRVAEGR